MKKWLIIGAAFVALLVILAIQQSAIGRLKDDRNRYKENTQTLLGDIERYRTKDELNAAKIGALQLTIDEYKCYRAADAELIKSLQVKQRDLEAVTTTQTQTIMELMATPKDTVIIRDSVRVPAVAVHCGDAWYDFDGLLADSTFTGTLAVRDSLVIAETVQYTRCLFKSLRRVKSRKIDVVSRNPHTIIVGCEHIIIEK